MTDHSSPSASNAAPGSGQRPGTQSPTAHGPASARFFGWMRSLGVYRQNGWIGGVCGGVAARLGIDPIIVRGIAIVIAVLGGPAFLLYAAAWALLPDAQGDIHLERLFRGHFDPPIIAIIVIALFSFLPFAQGFWWAGAQFWDGLSWFSAMGRVMWTLLVIALIVGVVVWAARSGRVPPTPPTSTPTSPTDAGGGAAYSGYASAAPASTTQEAPAQATAPASEGTASSADPAPPATPAQAATDDAYADWRTRQETWKADYAAWSAREADARAARAQRSAETRAQAQALVAEAEAARRARRAANPRTSAAYVGIALGVALVAGGVAGILAPSGLEVVVGLAIATLALGASIVLAGALRRRSGFLSFVSIVLLCGMLVAAVVPRHHALVGTDASYTDVGAVSILQPVGSSFLDYEHPGDYRADVVQVAGRVTITVGPDVSARVIVTQHTPGSRVSLWRTESDGNLVSSRFAPVSSDGITKTYEVGHGSPDVIVRVDQAAGEVALQALAPAD